jgi:hypothetical protein
LFAPQRRYDAAKFVRFGDAQLIVGTVLPRHKDGPRGIVFDSQESGINCGTSHQGL